MDIREELRRYILTNFLGGESAANLKDDAVLKDEGIIDSLATMKLISFVEETAGFDVDAKDLKTHFVSVDSIVAYVKQKTEG